MKTQALTCVNDRYDPEPSEYTDVEEFLAMCIECFGEAPELTESAPGYWFDSNGEITLELRS